MLPVLDSLDNYKMLSERMNVLTIYLPWGKLPVASNLRIVKTAVYSILVLVNKKIYNIPTYTADSGSGLAFTELQFPQGR